MLFARALFSRPDVLCLDELTQQLLERLDLPGVHCLPLAAVEDEAQCLRNGKGLEDPKPLS